MQLTRVLAVECAARGAHVNSFAPGAIKTGFVCDGSDEQWDAIASAHPLGRVASPEEIARVVLFLASSSSFYMTGSIVTADGGYTAT